ncbi:hypothetical protein ACFFW8_08810 [Erwinia tracheiphila]
MLMFAMGGISAPLTGIGNTSSVSMSAVLMYGYLLALLCLLRSETPWRHRVSRRRSING